MAMMSPTNPRVIRVRIEFRTVSCGRGRMPQGFVFRTPWIFRQSHPISSRRGYGAPGLFGMSDCPALTMHQRRALRMIYNILDHSSASAERSPLERVTCPAMLSPLNLSTR